MPMTRFYGLLLLPTPPSPPTPPAVRVAFKPPLDAVVNRIAEWSCSHGESATLDIALPCPDIHCSTFKQPDLAQTFDAVQRLLASVYSLLAATVERAGTHIDSRIILIDYDRNYDYTYQDCQGISRETVNSTSVVRLPVLASSQRLWTQIFAVDGEPGERLFQQFSYLSNGGTSERNSQPWQVERVRGGLVLHVATGDRVKQPFLGYRSYRPCLQVVTSGIYHLDFEAKLLLSMAAFLVLSPLHIGSAQQSCKVIIGIEEDAHTDNGNPHSEFVGYKESWDIRQKEIADFLLAILLFSPIALAPSIINQNGPRPEDKTVLVKLSSNLMLEFVRSLRPDVTAIGDESTSALLVSIESCDAVTEINKQRRERGWTPLEVFEVFGVDTEELDTDEDMERAKSSCYRRGL